MAQLTEAAYAGEWLKWFLQADYCLDMVSIDQDADATVGLVSGTVMKSGHGIAHGEGATADAILITPVSLADLISAAPGNFLALVAGPAIIDTDKMGLKTADNDMTDEKAGALAALLALNIKPAQSALAEWTTQTF